MVNMTVDTSSVTTKLSDFKVIRWKVKEESTAVHEFFVKPHHSPETHPRKPNGRTLLVLNIPSFVSKLSITNSFNNFGKINDVIMQPTPSVSVPPPYDLLFPDKKYQMKGFRVAYVVYQDPKSIREIMELNPDDISPLIINNIKSGLQVWMKSYNSQIVPEEQLEENIKKFMQEFEKEEIERKAREKMMEGQADEDGWVAVTRKGKGKRGGAIRTEKMEERLRAKKRRWEKSLMNFTPTQIKESRAKQLEELKKKFEEDRQRIAILKQQRKFKPF